MSINTRLKILSPNEALGKAKKYCDYQERSHQEVRDKLYSWGLHAPEVENIITILIEENFLNELRFAKAYARGKFRINTWGKIKIAMGLKQKNISEYCIKKALLEIDDEEYRNTLKQLLQKLTNALHKKTLTTSDWQKIARQAISKGFESNLVWELLKYNNEHHDQ